MRTRALLGVLLTVILGLTAVRAQVTGSLRVRLLDAATRAPLAGVPVTLSSAERLVPETTVATDEDGVALFPVLRAAGGYSVVARADGYSPASLTGVRVGARGVMEVEIRLAAVATEKLTVVAQKGEGALETTRTAATFGDAFIADLPVEGRLYQNVLTLSPGVQDPNRDGDPNVDGARDRDFKTNVGGVSNQDPLTGRFLSYVNPDSIEEIEVITAGAGAEFGRAQGGFANIVQKQGSNDFQGAVGLIASSSDLAAAPEGVTWEEVLPRYRQIQPSVSVSGPLLRDKLWFRLSHQYLDLDRPVNLVGSMPVSNYRQWIHSDQVTWQATLRDKLALLFQSDPSTVDNVGVSAVVPPEATSTVSTRAPTWSLTWTSARSANALIESQVAYQDFQASVTPATVGAYNRCLPIEGYLSTAQCYNRNTGTLAGSSPLTYADQRQRLTVRSQASLFDGRLWGGSHQAKIGFSVENERYRRDSTELPTMTFETKRLVAVVIGGTPIFNDYGFATIDLSLPSAVRYTATGTSWGIYAEDQFRPRPNFVVTAGLRIDRQEIESEGYEPFDPAAEHAQIHGPDDVWRYLTAPAQLTDLQRYLFEVTGEDYSLPPRYSPPTPFAHTRRLQDVNVAETTISPRLALSWDPWSDGRTRFAATWGRYYGSLYLLIPAYESTPLHATISKKFVLFFYPDGWYELSRGGAFNGVLSAYQVDRNLGTPFQDELTLSAEREIWPETTLRLTWIRRDFRDQLRTRDVNGLPGDLGRCAPERTIPVAPSPGTSVLPPDPATPGAPTDWLVDPSTGALYPDTDPGDGDGRLDDCQGGVVFSTVDDSGRPAFFPSYRPAPDGRPDLYQQNPLWGPVWRIGNYGSGRYEGLQLELVRRQYRGWQMLASYVYSRAMGDAEDFLPSPGADTTLVEPSYGYVGYDQRHVVKVDVATLLPHGVRLGGVVSWQSGLPWSVLSRDTTLSAIPPEYGGLGVPDPQSRYHYTTGQRNDQRNPSYWNVDLKVQKECRLPGRTSLLLMASVYNLFNDQAYRIYNRALQTGRQIDALNEAERLEGRRIELGFRLAF